MDKKYITNKVCYEIKSNDDNSTIIYKTLSVDVDTKANLSKLSDKFLNNINRAIKTHDEKVFVLLEANIHYCYYKHVESIIDKAFNDGLNDFDEYRRKHGILKECFISSKVYNIINYFIEYAYKNINIVISKYLFIFYVLYYIENSLLDRIHECKLLELINCYHELLVSVKYQIGIINDRLRIRM